MCILHCVLACQVKPSSVYLTPLFLFGGIIRHNSGVFLSTDTYRLSDLEQLS